MNLLAHPVIQQLFERNIPFEAENGEVVLHGFSKSGTARLRLKGETLVCHTRYGREDVIEHLDDIVNVAYGWWVDYRDRSPFEAPDERWVPHFVQRGWIQENAEVVKTYVPA